MIGIIMLDTQFPRLPGDIGNKDSFSNEPLYSRVQGATADVVVSDQKIDDALLDKFIQSALELQLNGATVIGTSCGFLASVQHEIEEALQTPFISSSLVLVPLLKTIFGPDSRIGVLTFDANKLGPIHFNGALDHNISIHGLNPSGKWYQCIANNNTSIDEQAAKQEALDVAARCVAAEPETRALLIECTNLSPWKKQMRQQLGLPVFDLVDALEWIDGAGRISSTP